VLDGGWVCLGRSADLAEPGSQRAESVGASGVLLVRDASGELRAFANVCRHRGHELLPCGATAVRGVVQCPYHAWSYELDGRLRLAPRAGEWLDPSALGLVALPVVEWGGWAFVNADGHAGTFDAWAGDLLSIVAPWDPSSLVVAAEHRYELAANWKLVCESYHECYHCPLIHPELCRVTTPTSGKNVRDEVRGAFLGGTMEISDDAETMSMSGRIVGSVLPGLSDGQRRQVVYLQLFPNLLVSLHPDYVMTHRLVPVSAQQTVVECQWLFAPGHPVDVSDAVDLWDLTNRQDWSAVESVQRGMASPHHRGGVLTHDEDAVYQFVAMVASAHAGLPLGRGAVAAGHRR
jgi:glycine betaine catabolism A